VTLASVIITRAYREGQSIAIVSSPTLLETTEALALLNTLILSTVGFEAGSELKDLIIGGEFDQSPTQWLPADVRLILNLASAKSLDLHPYPYEGQRVAISDAGLNLSSNNLTLVGNSRTIEGAASVVLSTDGLSREWMYSGGNWVKITSLAASDAMPFPEEFDDYFVTKLAMRLNPRNRSEPMSRETAAALTRAETMLKARYRRPRPRQEIGSLGLLGQRGLNDSSSLLQ
jgi:hypothetical protein